MSYTRDLFDQDESRKLREVGSASALAAEERSNAEWAARAESWTRGLVRGTRFTADDMAKAAGLPESRNAVGGILRRFRSYGYIAHTNTFKTSTRVNRRAGVQRVWVRL